MQNQNKEKIKEKIRENCVPLIVSIIFTVLFSFAKMGCDDIAGMHVEQGNLLSYWNRCIDKYYTWSSRVLVNFAVYIFTDHNPICWAIFNGISMFALIKALKILFADNKNSDTVNVFISCMVMLFPYWHLSSAGWISTVTTYFSPMAFGMLSLVPIKKIMQGEKISRLKFVLYLLCLIYGANNEQVMVVILLSYLVAFAWNSAVRRKWNMYLTIYTLAAIVSAIFIVTCPGNEVRKVIETKTWFPAYGQMNAIDKAELGYETAAQWLIFGNNLFFEAICLLLCILIWKKYSDSVIRSISVVPAIITIVFGPLMPLITGLYPQIDSLAGGVPYWGLVNPQNRGGLGPYFEFVVMTICLVIVIVNIFLLCKKLEQFVAALTLIAGGGYVKNCYGVLTNNIRLKYQDEHSDVLLHNFCCNICLFDKYGFA